MLFRSHPFEQCWAEGGGSEGKRPKRPRGNRRQSGAPKESAKVASSPDARVEVLVAHSADPSSVLLTDGLTHQTEWIIDSGATVHLCANRDWFTSYRPLNPPHKVILGNNNSILAPGAGQIEMTIDVAGNSKCIIVRDVLFCPMIAHNLLSVPQLTFAGAQARFLSSSCQIFNGLDKLIAVAHLKDGLYRLPAIIAAKEQAFISFPPSNLDLSSSAHVARSITASAEGEQYKLYL